MAVDGRHLPLVLLVAAFLALSRAAAEQPCDENTAQVFLLSSCMLIHEVVAACKPLERRQIG